MSLLSKFLKNPKENNKITTFPSNITDGHYMRFGFIDFRSRVTVGFNAGASREAYRRGNVSTNTKHVVCLYMPHQIQVNYGQGWEMSNNRLLGTGQQSVENRFNDPSTDTTSIRGKVGATAGVAYDMISTVARQAGGYVTNVNKLKMNVVNPFKEPAYDGPIARQFRFSWNFVPKSEQDCDTIIAIIKHFKKHSAPKATAGELRYEYPSEFQISFHSADTMDNKYLPLIGMCVCNNVSVNYTSAGIWSAYRNGMPVEIELSVEFQEVEIVTAAKVDEGY